ncbi:MAG TPA: 50S ribosomal protein L18 [Actinomycetota bacterium]|jgi:large subunit ribosomal protein L18|nr:50S ribosomal protein L18 [Actinomycetota bacterium]
MIDAKTKRAARVRRHVRVRKKVLGTASRPRLAVYRSNRHIYAQLIDDGAAATLVAASDAEATAKGGAARDGAAGDGAGGDGAAGEVSAKIFRAKEVGKLIAERAKGAGIDRAVFDRGGRRFHGRVAAVAEGAREGGLTI